MEQAILITIYIFDKDDDIDVIVIIILNIISGLGSSVFLVFMNVVRDYNALDNTQDAATGMINGFNFIGAIFTQQFVGIVLDANSKSKDYTTATYNQAFIIFPILGLLSIILTLIIKETYGEPIDLKTKQKSDKTDERSTKTNHMVDTVSHGSPISPDTPGSPSNECKTEQV